jgi:hypothetical protein
MLGQTTWIIHKRLSPRQSRKSNFEHLDETLPMSIEDCLRTSTFSTLELDALQDRFGARKFNDLIAKEISKEFNSKSKCRGKNFQETFMFVTLLTLIFSFYFHFKVAPFKLNPFYPNNLRHILIFYTATSPTYTEHELKLFADPRQPALQLPGHSPTPTSDLRTFHI